MKHVKLKILSLFMAVITLVGILTVFVSAIDEPDTSKAEAVCLYNTNTDKNILSNGMQKKIFPGGAVKMMTGLIACDMLADRLNEHVVITEEMLSGTTGYNIKLKAGMTVSLENLLYGVLCANGNDATLVLSNVCSGSIEAFVSMMNSKAAEWGLKNTYFTNPTGLDDSNMYSTLADIMILAKKAYKNDLYLQISSAMSYAYTPEGSDTEIKFFNRNALISTFYDTHGYRNLYASGLIASTTELGGYSVITYAEKKGTGYICAVMGAEADDNAIYSYEIANSLIKYAFENYSYTLIAEKGQYVCDAPVRLALPNAKNDETYVECIIDDDVYVLTDSTVTKDANLKYRYYLHSEIIDAPISAGDIVGGVDIIYNGEILGTARLVAFEDVEASGMLRTLDRLKDFFTGRRFWLCILFFAVLFGIYRYITVLQFRRKKVKKLKYKNYY